MATQAAHQKLSAGPSRHVFDVIVIGGQMGGALAAALLAKRGLRVMLVEHDGLGHGYAHGGFLLPYGPFISPPLKSMPAVEEAFIELGLATTVQRTLRTHTPDLQIVNAKHRLDLSHDEAHRQFELEREFGEQGARAGKQLKVASTQHESSDWFFKQKPPIPPEGFFERWNLKKLIRSRPGLDETCALDSADDGAAAAVLKLLPFLTHLTKPTSPLSRARPLSQVLRAPSRFPGGKEGIRELLTKRITELGGVVLGPSAGESGIVEALEIESNKIVGLKVLKSDNLYRAHQVLFASDSAVLKRLISDEKVSQKLGPVLEGVSTEEFLFTLNWVLPADALPRGMGDLVLVDRESPQMNPTLVQVDLARGVDGKVHDEKLRIVTAGAFVPESLHESGEGHQHTLAAQLAETLDWLMPFARDRLVLQSMPAIDSARTRGSRFLPHPHFAVGEAAFLGVTGLPQRTVLKNLLLANREVLPGLGFEGEMLAGVRAARLAQELLKKRDPLRG